MTRKEIIEFGKCIGFNEETREQGADKLARLLALFIYERMRITKDQLEGLLEGYVQPKQDLSFDYYFVEWARQQWEAGKLLPRTSVRAKQGGKRETPQRMQMRRTKGWRRPPGAVYVGRPTKWGNPFSVAEHGREEAVRLYRQHVADRHDEIRRELAGKDLMCWCPLGSTCHADVLLEIANS